MDGGDVDIDVDFTERKEKQGKKGYYPVSLALVDGVVFLLAFFFILGRLGSHELVQCVR